MSEPVAFDGDYKGLAPLSGGKRKKGNGHKATCGCPICNNMRKKGKKGGVLLVGGEGDASAPTEDDETIVPIPSASSSSEGMAGGRRRRSRSRSKSRSRSRSRSSRKSMQGGRKSRKSKRRR
jgi:hypothetical protein